MGLIVTDEIRARFRDYRALVLGGRAPSELPEIAAWRTAMSAFGCKPSRYPCSAEALLKRVARGDPLAAINRLVHAYNAVSIAHALPLGGEDFDQVSGDVRLVPAVGDEDFDGDEGPRPGEVVWRDDIGATCGAWNWRQGRRTRITERSENVYFLLESLQTDAHARLEPAADELAAVLGGTHTELRSLP
jgi:DNA/RNA-binding domain of Phe-tRNA-synthetase-like protein